ncbi:amino acid adenylation domain-containing protein [Anaerolineales bacterium HSG25]|nr:amino acid adenylation domain-containing protein [Anaerolineales bacterium HSG25]
MPQSHDFSCYIIGEETMPIQCAELLLEQGHTIYGMISPDEVVEKWAIEKEIPFISPTQDISAFLSRQPFDYLFSIVNSVIISPEILALPRQYAINYHDSLLPRYAGNYATSWALINEETCHGISWHVMVERVDAGDLLKQAPVKISPTETALSLNAKCYGAAISAFAELIDDLATNRIQPQAQDLSERTFFSFYKRPAAGGLIDWRKSAKSIFAFIRALQFGPYPNFLGLPKFSLRDGRYLIVQEASLIDMEHDTAPGTIVQISSDSIQVATSSGTIALHEFLTVDGVAISLNTVISQFGLSRGDQLNIADESFSSQVTTLNQQICKKEQFWLHELNQRFPLTLPYTLPKKTIRKKKTTANPRRYNTFYISIPDAITAYINAQSFVLSHFLVAAFVAYLARLSRVNQFSIGFYSDSIEESAATKLYAPYLPFNIAIDLTWSFPQIYQAVTQQINRINDNLTYPRDILARYPELNQVHSILPNQIWPILIGLIDNFNLALPVAADFTMHISEKKGGWQWVYDTNLFEPDSIDNMSQQFFTLLDSLTQTEIDTPFWNLDILTKAEQLKLLVDWNQTDVVYPQRDQCIHHLFEAQVEQTPSAIAVVYESEQLTYQELNEQANQLAHHLQMLGVEPEQPVGICLRRSLDLIIALLATLKVGGMYVPLNDTYPVNRLAFMLEDTEAPLLLTHQELLPLFPEYGGRIICLDDEPTWQTENRTNPKNTVTNTNLAYVIYTSGSTGQAKGVMVNHHSLVNAYFAWEDAYQLQTTATNHLQMANFSFDVFSGDWVRALCSGGKLVICPYDTLLTPHKLYALMHEQKINCAEFVPAVFRPLLQHVEEIEQNFDFMRVLIVASDNWYVGECDKIHRFCGPETRLINSYGLTEATIDSTYFDCDALYEDDKLRPDTSFDRLVPIGRPFANTKLYILDPYMQPVPVGIAGELYVGGAGLARGYLKRPELTANRFIANIFNDMVDEQLYRTGDLARYLPDGNIEFLGRADYQIKIRGFRIELGEIETTLNNHPNIQTCVVVDRESNVGEKFLVAYIVPKQQPAPTTEILRDFLKNKIPDYMIPPVFMILLKLPLTGSGKINRQALPIPNHYNPENAKNYVAPRNSVEAVLADVWANVLMLDKVGVESDFFALGGHSLLATRLLSWLHKSFQIKLPLRTLFEQPTISQQALTLTKFEKKSGQVKRIASLRQKVKQMSTDDVKTMLKAKQAK